MAKAMHHWRGMSSESPNFYATMPRIRGTERQEGDGS
jgi:hypothetical protein